jgi:hypothetical protein
MSSTACEQALGCAPGQVSAARGADGCWELACVLYHGRQDEVGACVSDRLQSVGADVFALCLIWAVNHCGLRSITAPVTGPLGN